MSLLRRLARVLNLPIRRILDHRFHDIAHRVQLARGDVAEVGAHVEDVRATVDQRIGEAVTLQVESLSLVGQELRTTTGELAAVTAEIGAIRDLLPQLTRDEHDRAYRERLAYLSGEATISELDQSAADLINYALSHRGFAAQAKLWVNPPLVLAHRAGSVELSTVNERIAEVPFAMRALGGLEPGARVLDFGSAESTVSLSLASLGFQVTALDLSRYPFTHPNLTVVASPLEKWEAPEEPFDAALVISTVEHVGLGWYGEDPSDVDDIAAMGRIRDLVRPGGLIVLTVPYGTPSISDVQRTYDAAGVGRLVEGLDVVERLVLEETDGTWLPVEDSTGHAVALVTARVPDS